MTKTIFGRLRLSDWSPASNNHKKNLAQFKLNHKMFIAFIWLHEQAPYSICNILQVHYHRNTNGVVCQLMKNKLRLAVLHSRKLRSCK